jgi:hypothetical protein
VAESLELAYVAFAASLLAGRFSAPEAGERSAELVAAHVVRNNDLIAEAAEGVILGEDVAYDNAASIDEAELARFAERLGGLTGLAREVERSARLARVYVELGAARETPVHVHIEDNGELVLDGPIPIGTFIEGNADFRPPPITSSYRRCRALGSPIRPRSSTRTRSSSSFDPPRPRCQTRTATGYGESTLATSPR